MNNKYNDCVPRMSYAFMTSWKPRCSEVYEHLQNSDYKDSYSQRMYLTHNAEEIMKRNAEKFYLQMNCGECMSPYNVGTMLPEHETQECNERTCTYRTNDPFGLGTGRQYYNDDQEEKAKAAFLSAKEKEQEFFKSSKECWGASSGPEKYYPLGSDTVEPYPRTAVPSGAIL